MTRAEMDRLLESLSDVELEDLENGIGRERKRRERRFFAALRESFWGVPTREMV